MYESTDRIPLLTYGANSSPERLALKLAHLPGSDHAYENPAAFMAEHYASFRAASAPFESDHWTKMPVYDA